MRSRAPSRGLNVEDEAAPPWVPTTGRRPPPTAPRRARASPARGRSTSTIRRPTEAHAGAAAHGVPGTTRSAGRADVNDGVAAAPLRRERYAERHLHARQPRELRRSTLDAALALAAAKPADLEMWRARRASRRTSSSVGRRARGPTRLPRRRRPLRPSRSRAARARRNDEPPACANRIDQRTADPERRGASRRGKSEDGIRYNSSRGPLRCHFGRAKMAAARSFVGRV